MRMWLILLLINCSLDHPKQFANIQCEMSSGCQKIISELEKKYQIMHADNHVNKIIISEPSINKQDTYQDNNVITRKNIIATGKYEIIRSGKKQVYYLSKTKASIPYDPLLAGTTRLESLTIHLLNEYKEKLPRNIFKKFTRN